MDYGPIVRRAARRIGEAIDGYARTRGWSPGDYRWFYRAQPEWGHIHVILVARGFKGRGYSESYRSVMEFLKGDLADEPGLVESLGLVVRDFDQVAEGGLYAIGPDYEEFWSERPVAPAR